MLNDVVKAVKGLAIIAVVAIHVLSSAQEIVLSDVFLLGVVTRFCTPIYFFVSGYLNYSSYRKDFSLKRLVLRRICRLMPAYFLWSLAGFLVYVFVYKGPASPPFVAARLLTGQVPGAFQLYYIPALLQCYLFLPAARSSLGYLLVAFSFLFLVCFDGMCLSYPGKAVEAVALIRSTCLPWAGYFLAGCLYARSGGQNAKLPVVCLLVLAGAVALTADVILNLSVGVPPAVAIDFFKPGIFVYSLALAIFLFRVFSFWRPKIFVVLGSYSFEIYLCHYTVIYALGAVCPDLFSRSPLVLTLGFLPFLLLFSFIYHKITGGRF
jgi:peptidoglycan/LPS O-acetylase OafA/YrhL